MMRWKQGKKKKALSSRKIFYLQCHKRTHFLKKPLSRTSKVWSLFRLFLLVKEYVGELSLKKAWGLTEIQAQNFWSKDSVTCKTLKVNDKPEGSFGSVSFSKQIKLASSLELKEQQ